MRECVLDGSRMASPADFYEQFFAATKGAMPDYGGRCLDALNDDLQDLWEPLTVVWESSAQARAALGDWFEECLSVLRDRGDSEPPLTVILQ